MALKVGLIFPGNQEQIPFAFELYQSYSGGSGDEKESIVGLNTTSSKQERAKLSKKTIDMFRKTFSRPSTGVHFLVSDRIYLRDTVSSIGIQRQTLLPLTNSCQHIQHFRHALALDERRVKFLPEHVGYPSDGEVDDNHVKEVWFAGTHSDIGGGNTQNVDLNRSAESLVWMIHEAKAAGLRFDSRNLGSGVKPAGVIPSLTGAWWILEWLPLVRASSESNEKRTMWPHCGRGRHISANHKIHYSVLANYQASKANYSPWATYKEPTRDAGAHMASSKPEDGSSQLNSDISSTLSRRARWDQIFTDAAQDVIIRSRNLRWEGDRKILEVLRVVRGFRDEESSPSDQQGQDSSSLLALKELADDDLCAKMIWEYGGLPLLVKIAESKSTDLAQKTVRAVLGMGVRIGIENKPEKAASILSIDTRELLAIDEQEIPFPSAFQMDSEYSRKVTQDVIPRISDLLTYDPHEKQSIRGIRFAFLDAVRTRRNTSVNSANTNLNLLKLVQMVIDIIIDLADEGFSRAVAIADIVQRLVPLLTLTPVDEFRPLILKALEAITSLSARDELARTKLYPEHTMSKVKALMKHNHGHDHDILEATLRATTALAADHVLGRILAERGIVQQIMRSLSDDIKSNGQGGTIRAIRNLSRNRTGGLELFESGIIARLRPFLTSSSDVMCIFENLATHAAPRRYMIEQGILTEIVNSIGGTVERVSRRALYTMAAFAASEDGSEQINKQNAISKLLPVFGIKANLLYDVLEVIEILFDHERLHPGLASEPIVEAVIEALKEQHEAILQSMMSQNVHLGQDLACLDKRQRISMLLRMWNVRG
ncbi:hypothetical protein FRC07_009516 [Ceratobasidium sp. 392]|nr:hypothetical protein FRC07_009516 [Ceratobasidium sp. 392]